MRETSPYADLRKPLCIPEVAALTFETGTMSDLLYVLLAIGFFILCWAFTKTCDRL